MKKYYTKITAPDVAVTALALIFSFWFLFMPQGQALDSNNLTLQLYRDGQLLKETALTTNAIINLELDKSIMKVEVEKEKGAHILHSDCPAKVCVHTGWIKRPGETIVCLPNKVLLEIKGAKEEFHAISY